MHGRIRMRDRVSVITKHATGRIRAESVGGLAGYRVRLSEFYRLNSSYVLWTL
jgi:hypothetical protein